MEPVRSTIAYLYLDLAASCLDDAVWWRLLQRLGGGG
jgi:hypothetical protein